MNKSKLVVAALWFVCLILAIIDPDKTNFRVPYILSSIVLVIKYLEEAFEERMK